MMAITKPTTISILCPTRERPELFARMVESVGKTAEGDVEILAFVDDDDPKQEEYLQYFASHENKNVHCVSAGAPVKSVGVAWNALARVAKGDLFMMANDDLVFKTPRWDGALYDVLNATGWWDGIYCAHCDDGAPNAKDRICFPFVSRRWYEALGYFTPECFHFLWHDTWVGDIAKRINRSLYVPTVLIEHRHFTFKKAVYDATYQRHRVGPENEKKRAEDQSTYKNNAGLRQQHADTLLKAITAASKDGAS